MTTEFDSMTDAERGEWYYRHRGELGGEDITDQVEVASPLMVSMSFRATREEASAIRRHASDAGMSVSELVRAACQAWTGAPRHRDPDIERLHDDVTALRDQVSAIQRQLDRAGIEREAG